MQNSLKLYRAANQITQRQMAERLGISQAYLCHIEQSQKNPSVGLAALIERETDGVVRVEGWPNMAPLKEVIAARVVAALKTIGH